MKSYKDWKIEEQEAFNVVNPYENRAQKGSVNPVLGRLKVMLHQEAQKMNVGQKISLIAELINSLQFSSQERHLLLTKLSSIIRSGEMAQTEQVVVPGAFDPISNAINAMLPKEIQGQPRKDLSSFLSSVQKMPLIQQKFAMKSAMDAMTKMNKTPTGSPTTPNKVV